MSKVGTSCRCVWGDIHRNELVVAMDNGAASVVTLDGDVLGAILPESLDYRSYVAMLPYDDIVVVGQYNAKTISAYQWRTGERLWRHDDYDALYGISCHSRQRAVVLQLTGQCTELDVLTGSVIARLDRVVSAHTESTSDRILLDRGRRCEPQKVLELRQGLGELPVFASRRESDGNIFAAFGRGWLAASENQFGTLTSWHDNGIEQWRYVPDGETRRSPITDQLEGTFHFRALTTTASGSQVFGIKRSKVEREANEAIFFDAHTGVMLRNSIIADDQIADIPVAEGQILASRDGLLHLPSLKWEPRTFRVR